MALYDEFDPNGYDTQEHYSSITAYNAVIAIKLLKVITSTVQAYQIPRLPVIKNMLVEYLHLYSAYTGFTVFASASNAVLIADTYFNHGAQEALGQAVHSIWFMRLSSLLAASSPYAAVAFTSFLIGYTGYHAISEAYEIYQLISDSTHEIESFRAYRDAAGLLHDITGLSFFAQKVQEYEDQREQAQIEFNLLIGAVEETDSKVDSV